MAELNLDISQELNITARRGDSISFTLQFKDSSGDALDLSSDADDNDENTDETTYKFNMEVRTAADDDSDTPVLMNKINEITTLPQSGAATVSGATGEITVGVGSASSGQVSFSVGADSMKDVPAGVYVYDIEQVKQVGDVVTKQTWVRGTFTVNEDITIS